jgi:hypothetical protein
LPMAERSRSPINFSRSGAAIFPASTSLT